MYPEHLVAIYYEYSESQMPILFHGMFAGIISNQHSGSEAIMHWDTIYKRYMVLLYAVRYWNGSNYHQFVNRYGRYQWIESGSPLPIYVVHPKSQVSSSFTPNSPFLG